RTTNKLIVKSSGALPGNVCVRAFREYPNYCTHRRCSHSEERGVMTLKNCVSSIATYGLVLLCLASASSPAFAAATCTLNTANRTVTICTPSNGATVNTTFHVNAGSTDTTAPVTYMQVYVNGVAKLTQNRNFIDADLTLPAGSNQRFT